MSIQIKQVLILLALSPIAVYAQKTPYTTKAKIQQATVYKEGATLTHTANVQLPKGNHEIVIANVANSLNESSIQVQAPAQLTIMSLSFSKTYKEDKTKTIQLPNSELQVAQRQLIQLDNKLKAEEQTLQMLEANKNINGANTGLSVAELSKMTLYYKQQQNALRDTISMLQEKKALQQQVVQELQKKAGLSQKTIDDEGGYIILQVQAKQALQADVKISYYTPNANWIPSYDIRVANTLQPLQIAYKGDISQTTGIAWNNTLLELSSYNPSQGNIAPQPYTWFLSYESPYQNNAYGKQSKSNIDMAMGQNVSSEAMDDGQPGSGQRVIMRGLSSVSGNSMPLFVVDGVVYTGDISQLATHDILTIDVIKDAAARSLYGSRGANGVVVITTKGKGMTDQTTVTEMDLNTTFSISTPYDIASNGKQHSVILKEFQHPAVFTHYALPKLDKDAFMIANLTAFQQMQMLPGAANIIFDNTYVGKTWINPLVVQDSMQVSVGRDKKVAIERIPIVDKKNTKILSGKKTQVVTYDIKVKNTKSEAIQLTLEEMYPIATESGMEVELLESSNANVDKEKALLTWQLSLAANESKTVRISYKVQYPSNKNVEKL